MGSHFFAVRSREEREGEVRKVDGIGLTPFG